MAVQKYFYPQVIGYWLLILLCPLFFLGGPDYESVRSVRELWNIGHVCFFIVFAFVLFLNPLLKNYIVSGKMRAVVVCAAVLFVGAGVEIVQSLLPGREASLIDILRDLGGGVIGVSLAGTGCLRRGGGVPVVVVVLVSVACCWQLGLVILDEYRAYRSFPLLAGFEQQYEFDRWTKNGTMSRVSSPVKTGTGAARIELSTELYSGVSLHYFPSDWRGMEQLVFSVYNPEDPVELHYRIHDIYHKKNGNGYGDRFNGFVILAPGWNDIVIELKDIHAAPLTREMDMSAIRGFGLFVIQQPRSRILYLDDVRLVSKKKLTTTF